MAFKGYTLLGGGFFNILHVHPANLGKISNLTSMFFSDGLVQPPTRMIHVDRQNPAFVHAGNTHHNFTLN